MMISQILDLVKQYIIKGIIDLPSNPNFQTTDLYKTIFILLGVIVLELIFYYISNITRTIHVVKKQTPYISEKLFNNLDKKKYSFFADNYTGKISTAINDINDEVINLNEKITRESCKIIISMAKWIYQYQRDYELNRDAKKGGSIAGVTRKKIEKQLGKPVVTSKNAND